MNKIRLRGSSGSVREPLLNAQLNPRGHSVIHKSDEVRSNSFQDIGSIARIHFLKFVSSGKTNKGEHNPETCPEQQPTENVEPESCPYHPGYRDHAGTVDYGIGRCGHRQHKSPACSEGGTDSRRHRVYICCLCQSDHDGNHHIRRCRIG